MKGKTLKQITNTPKAGLKELPSLPNNEDFNIEVTSKESGKKYTVSTNILGSGGLESVIAGDNITIDDTDPQNPIISATGTGGGQIAFTKTKAEIDALIAGNDLVAGALYEITGVHPSLYNDGTTSGTTVYLRAISGRELEVQGMGKFYNPKYNQSVDGFGIWENKMYGTFSTIVGTFDYQNKETVTADNGATGILLADGMIQYVSGNWSPAISITGGTSSATANVADFVSPSYAVNDKVIWGGYSWTNVNGNIGASTDVLNLDSEWTKDVYDTTNYNVAYDVIEYDYANDFIVRRYNKEANIDVKCSKAQYDFFVAIGISLHPIIVQQWGNNFDISLERGQLNIICNGGYNESVNFSGSFQYNLTFGSGSYQSYLTFGSGSFQYNLTFGSGSYQSYLTFGSNASQNNLTFESDASQYNLTFGSNAYQHNLTFGSNASQGSLTFESGANQLNLTFGSNAYQHNLTFGSGANQQNLTFGSNASQDNLTFESGAYQAYLNFAENTQLNYNNQTINSNMEYVSFRTKTKVVPNLSAATYIYDGNIKEVYQRPDDALKIRYYDNSDALVIADITD